MARAGVRPGMWLLMAAFVILAAVPRSGSGANCRVVVDLSRHAPGAYPDDWRTKEESDARGVYKVLVERGLRFIRATAEQNAVHVGKEFDWDLKTDPVLRWKWRPRVFPKGADERNASTNDSALGVYVVFPHSPVSVKSLKYVWSAAVPVGTTATASGGLTRMLVLRSGQPKGTGWVEESVNVPRDYQRLFGEAPKTPRGIGILTDADDTKSQASGDYVDFRICPAGAGRTAAR